MTPSTPPGDSTGRVHDELNEQNAQNFAAVEAEIRRLREREAQGVEMNEHYQRKADEAEARVQELEAALREIAEMRGTPYARTGKWYEIARRALAHEEEA